MAKKFDYFETLEKQGNYAVLEAEMLLNILRNYNPTNLPTWLVEMHELETAADEQIHQIYSHLATEFITPIDREDILSMGQRLDDIVDFIEDVLQQLHMYNVQEIYNPAFAMAELILNSSQTLKKALTEFRTFKKTSSEVRRYVVEVNDIENQADRVYTEIMLELFRDHTSEPLFVMIWSNLYDRMERVVDACETVADMIDTVILKNS
jgi:predicted phosphate transport protein (TIGR00153 family)